MAFYRVCSCCGAALDPGERCDCQDKKETAPVLQHQSGSKVKVIDQTTFTSILPKNKEEIKYELC